jgi:transposase
MLKPKTLQEIRAMKFLEIYDQCNKKSLTIEEAAMILGVCEKTFRRWRERYEEEGAEGLLDKRLGKMANNAAPVDEVMEMVNLFETKYLNFGVKHLRYLEV